MSTILQEVLSFTGISIAGGATWDAIKLVGQKLISSFKNKFTDLFKGDDKCETFIKKISTTESLSTKNPLNDVRTIYEDITDNNFDNDNFQNLFLEWIKDNKLEFDMITKNGINQSGQIIISGSQDFNTGTINNVVNQINNGIVK